ncbi:MAG: signal peptidase I [Haloplanus sp.]
MSVVERMNVFDSDRETLRTVANVLGVVVLLAAVSPFVVYAVPGVVGADHGMVVLSGSMEPKMSPGDAVIVREVPPSEIEEGDVITFRTDSQTPTTHRVVDIRQTERGVAYVTKGDANEEADRGLVLHSQVVGEVAFVIPYLGHVIQFANTRMGFLTLVLTPLALFVASELWELAASIRGSESTAETTSADADVPPDAVAASTAAADGTDAADADSGGFTLTQSSLQLLTLLLGFYVPYSGYVAYTTREAWSIGVATATAIAFLFGLVTYLASRGSGSGSGSGSDGAARSIEGVVRRGELPARLGERTTVPLDSVESLVQMAVDRDDWVIYDEEQATYYMARDDALYLHRAAAPEPDGGTTISETEAEAEATADDATPTGGETP